MAHGYCPDELVFGKTSNLQTQFNTIKNIEPLYNIDDYARERKWLEIAHKRARIMIEETKRKNKEFYDNTANEWHRYIYRR